ncbi:type I-C CRISPR-associated protein Cas5c [Olsenella sp. YH-ols2217]|uniref:pre-crRNA processing endonuclease n=1 Tax=Kribbibacterium absianum TaxID=3044210 RepID=A0ABT6ZK58_9ACTN|nr:MULTISPECIES: type I-C CRISPR-associated protein Cas5c [unclassified Olsenella]MDJ1122917.1 type I-C CRISPR-associated protein Cas5c [Olsenella sp. YH-ols2216]MDJ1129424.1 type I-C CRISPR-associated protein Cas5c [Olsenella sp. YH-ols2217]
MAKGTRIEFSAPYALFSRPELSVERYSYDVPTPSALRGAIEAVFWHPGMRYVIDRIHVLNPIERTSVRRNELGSKASANVMKTAIGKGRPLPSVVRSDVVQQRANVMLTNVRYVVDFHFDLTPAAAPTDTPAKFISMLNRRIQKGQCFSQPYLGTRECSADFRPVPMDEEPQGFYAGTGERDLGLMLYDLDYSDPANIQPMFFHAVMRDGVVDVAGSEVFR